MLRRLFKTPISNPIVLTEDKVRPRILLASKIPEVIEAEGMLSPEELAMISVTSDWKELQSQEEHPTRDQLLEDAFHCLQHFLSDRDIRIRNGAYAEQQIDSMKKYLKQLEA